ncbi:MAG: methyltransferase domain-containing protein, partial [bacterium]
NCVINLSPEKDSVYREMHRVLRPGGRLSITDILTAGPLPEEVRENLALVSACVGGAATVEETRRTLEDSGFTDIRIGRKGVDQEAARYLEAAGLSEMAENVFSATIEAVKPV